MSQLNPILRAIYSQFYEAHARLLQGSFLNEKLPKMTKCVRIRKLI
jgi:hypothetical protein